MTSKSPDPADIAMGKRIRKLREVAGISQTRLAEACGVTFRQIQKYENGANRVSYSRLGQIAAAFNLRVEQLLPTKGETSQDAAILELLGSNPDTADLEAVRLYCELPVGARRTIQQAIESLHAAYFPARANDA